MTGEADLSRVGELFADRTRSRMLMALASGKELPASVLASEAGVTRSTASSHLKKLSDGGLLAVAVHGRNRYYRLADQQVAEVIEKLLELAPAEPITSLRAETKAAKLRLARTCYDHFAGKLGVAVMESILRHGFLQGGDGRYRFESAREDRPASPGRDIDYQSTSAGADFFATLGVQLTNSGRPLVRYCIDWTEQRHHVAGQLGRGIFDRFLAENWIVRRNTGRALQVTDSGVKALKQHFDVVWSG